MSDNARASVEGTWVRQLLLFAAIVWFGWEGLQGAQIAIGFALVAAALIDWRGFFGVR